MKTPYDTAVRLRQREMDDLRTAINAEQARLVQIDNRLAATEAAKKREAALAKEHHRLNPHAYLELLRAERARLLAERNLVETRLGALRDEAGEALGVLRATEMAADAYRAEAERLAANAEQAMFDDIAASALVRREAGR